ncbi:MAG: hypothetical protein ACNA8L_11195 [Luteolibacter sp.]|jgi:hypothetical protein
MDPINPWIDPNETRRMAERLMLPPRDPVQAPDDTGFDDSFVGFSDPEDAEEAAETPVPEATGGFRENEPAAVDLGPIADGGGYPNQRAMLREQFDAIAAFLVDAAGEVVFNEGKFEAFHFIARDLVASDAKPGPVRLKVGGRSVLEIIPLQSDSGLACLCVVLPAPLSHDAVGQIRLQWLGVDG